MRNIILALVTLTGFVWKVNLLPTHSPAELAAPACKTLTSDMRVAHFVYLSVTTDRDEMDVKLQPGRTPGLKFKVKSKGSWELVLKSKENPPVGLLYRVGDGTFRQVPKNMQIVGNGKGPVDTEITFGFDAMKRTGSEKPTEVNLDLSVFEVS